MLAAADNVAVRERAREGGRVDAEQCGDEFDLVWRSTEIKKNSEAVCEKIRGSECKMEIRKKVSVKQKDHHSIKERFANMINL